MGAAQRLCGNLAGGPSASPGLCWLRARLELGRSRRWAARVPFRVRAGRVSTEADRLPFEGRVAPSSKPVGRRCSSSSSTCFFRGKTALHDKVGGAGSEESEESDESQPGTVYFKSPDKLVIFDDRMNRSVSKELVMEAEGKDGGQGGRHSHDMRQQSSMAPLVGQPKVGEVMVSEEIVTQSESLLVVTSQGSGDPVPPRPPTWV
ncbi:hypothetical protein NDU88_002724 [Pleurodeles waltl]|uniref:Uncharacterized protein n=1 Tax=Pleurodeles waltl TaxID=8319 RepID=A0AAV7T318_PLEWA|nr:hypothetical protein NDU88_002724 [Pleurodeles waltl]